VPDSTSIFEDGTAGSVVAGQQEVALSREMSSIGIRGPPDLPGMRLVDPDFSNWQGQIIYVNFDGAQSVTYHGPVTVGPFDVPTVRASGELAGQEQTIVADVLVRLQETFAGSGILFTAEKPSTSRCYSTIYVGGDDSAFSQYGSFLGLAEKVDAGNADHGDEAIVFAAEVAAAYPGPDVYCTALARTIAHETGHLIGFCHVELRADVAVPLRDVALPVELTLGAGVTGTLDSTGDSDTYSVNVQAGEHLVVQLDGDNEYDDNEVYLRYGFVPTVTEYDAAGKEANRPDQYAEISGTQAGTYYVLVRCASDSYFSDAYTVRADTDATLPTLTLGTEVIGTLETTYDQHLYRAVPGPGEHLVVQLDGDNEYDDNEVYLRYGSVPTVTEYDAAGKEANRPDQYAEVSSTQAGTYYVLVRCASDSYFSDAYTVRADTLASVPLLPLPGQVTGTLDDDGDRAWYMLSVPAPEDIVLALTADSSYPQNRLYLRSSSLPTPDTYDYAALADGPNQFLMLSALPAGAYYVLIEALRVWPADNFTLSAETGMTLHSLQLGVPKAITLVGGSADCYYVDVPTDAVGGQLFVTLQKNDSWSGSLSVTPPGASSSGRTGSSDLLLQVPISTAGRYLVQLSGPQSKGAALAAATSLPELTLGDWTVGTILRTYGSAWYQLDVPASQTTLSVDVETLGLWSTLQVFQTTLDATPDWTATGCKMHLDIPNPPAGRYYIHLTDSAWITGPQSRDHMILVDTTGQPAPPEDHAPVITGLSTYTGGTGVSVTVIISGAWLSEDATVTLKRDGYPEVLAHYVLGTPDAHELTATFDLTSTSAGEWTLLVTDPDTQAAQAPQPFTVTSGGEARPWVEVIGRDTIRAGRESTCVLRYGNSGTVDANHVWLFVAMPTAIEYEIELPWQMSTPPAASPSVSDWGDPAKGTLMEILSLPANSFFEVPITLYAPDVTGEMAIAADISLDASQYFESLILGVPDDPLMFLGTEPLTADATSAAALADTIGLLPPAGHILFWDDYPGGFTNHVAKSIGGGRYIEMTSSGIHIGTLEGEYATPSQGPGKSGGYLGDVKPSWWNETDAQRVVQAAARIEELIDQGRLVSQYTQSICQNRFDRPTETKPGTINTNCVGLVWFLNPQFVLGARTAFSPESMYDELKGPGSWQKDAWVLPPNQRVSSPSKVANGDVVEKDGQIYHEGEEGYSRLRMTATKLLQFITSVSPEDKYGPAGYGAERWIAADGEIHYRTDFWNKEDAPANTQEVIIKDQLDSDLDWSTFAFTRTGFLRWDRPLDGGQYFNIDVDMRPDMNLIVNVEGTFNSETGEIQWVFRSLDPDTGTWPEDPTAGFLPPITSSGYEIGWVEYTVEQKPGLPTGTTISNQAWVKFDTNPYNPAPKAGPWVNTIDAGTPQSNVLPLAATSTSAAFLVSWTGQDDAGGSGIASYDIYVSTDGGGYTLWKDATAETSATYTGQAGHTYGIYSVACDHVGHQEQTPDTPDTTVIVLSPVYRFWKPADNTHFYTIKGSEKQKLIDNYSDVYTFEGPAYYAFTAGQQSAGTLPVYRFWKPSDNTHFYTIRESEKQKLIDNYSAIYTYEGPAFYAYATGQHPIDTLPVYRFWKWRGNTHFFTIKESEKDKLINLFPDVFTYENAVWYAYAV